jgi:outer membrane protein assembly factor BamB
VSLDNGYAVTQFYYGAGNDATSVVVGGTQDNGTLCYTPAAGPNAWNKFFSGDGGAVGSDPSDPKYYYGEYAYLQIFRNTDGGASSAGSDYICGRYWNGAQWVWKPLPFTIPDAQSSDANFIAPFVLDPNDPNRILGGGLQLWRTNDAKTANTPASGPRWAAIKPSINSNPDSYISAIVVGPGNSGLILVGHNNGQVFKTTNGTGAAPVWTRIDNSGPTPINASRACLSLTIDPRDSKVFYATFAGYQPGNVWKSTDGGLSWRDLSGVLPWAPVRDIAVHPQKSDWVYAATEVGLFASEDGGQHWSPTNEGPANVATADLFWMGNTLLAATHGRGFFSAGLAIYARPESVMVGDVGGALYRVDAQNGTESARVEGLGGITSSVLAEGTTVWLGSQDGKVYARHAATLAQVWQQSLGASVDATPQLYRPQDGGDPQLVAAAANGHLYVLQASDGTVLWSLDVLNLPAGTKKTVFSSFVMADWAYLASEAGIYTVNLATKTVGWTDSSISCKTPLLLAANQVFAPTASGTVQAYDARTGARLWSFTTGSASTAQPAWVLGAVVCGDSQGRVFGLDYRTGAQRFNLTKSGESIQSLAATGNRLYIVGNAIQGNLYAYKVTPANPAPWPLDALWSVPLAIGASRPALTAGNHLYVTAINSQLQAYDTVNGSLQWSFNTKRPALASPAAVFPG